MKFSMKAEEKNLVFLFGLHYIYKLRKTNIVIILTRPIWMRNVIPLIQIYFCNFHGYFKVLKLLIS